MGKNSSGAELLRWLERRREEMVEGVRALVEHESPSTEKTAVDALARKVGREFERRDVFALTVNQAAESSSQPGAPFTMPDIVPSRPEVVQEEPLQTEIKSFLHSVATRSKPVVTLEDGRRALAVALEILSAIEKHSRHAKLDLLSKA